jgi:Cutinase/von Willebrand factor type A domain/PKD domain
LKRFLSAVLVGALSAVGLVASMSAAHAAAIDDACAHVEAVWARGSGQGLGAGEANRFKEQLENRIASATATLHVYELGTDAGTYDGHTYQAVNVSDVLNGNAIGAKFSAGYGNDYGRSVDGGVGELYTYLLQRQEKCGTARFVLGGYSQGAQVVGQTLEKLASEQPGSMERIDFSALFGDPKLYLPEGIGAWPPACRGEDFSLWRRTVPDCDTDNGSLGARNPYLPTTLTSKIGLWCYDDDFVCGSDARFWVTEGHMKYGQEGGAIDDAVREMAQRLKETLPPAVGAGLNTSIMLIGTGTAGLDVVFLIDTTGSMGDDIDEAKQFASTMASTIHELRGRVALVGYRDAGDAYTATVFSSLQSDLTEFQTQLDGLEANGGGDTPEGLLHALMAALDGLDWRSGATKAAIVLTDADYHEPDLVDGSTVNQVADRALEIDPVNVYPVVPEFLQASYNELANLTSGQVIVNTGDTAASLTAALTRIRNRPVALLPSTAYYGQPGEQFTFDASKSYAPDSRIVTYDWDFNGDGDIDRSTTDPTVTHVYEAPFDGSMQVRVTAADGGVANASALVHVGTKTPGLAQPAMPTNLAVQELSTAGGVSTVRLSWTPADAMAARWAITVNGVPVGVAAAATTSVEITDVDRSADVVLGVAGVTTDGVVGDAATVVLPKSSTQTPPPPTIDVAPGSTDNVVSLRRPGVIPVALLSSPSFKATAVDYRKLCFGDAETPAERDCSESHGRSHSEDVNGDGRQDLVLHYDAPQVGIDASDTRACLSGRLPSGSTFESCDTIRVVR